MKLTTKGRYALTAILDMVENYDGENPIRLQDISERQNISLHYLEQIFRKLRKDDIVRSIKGPGGGYVLNCATKVLTVKRILEAVGEALFIQAENGKTRESKVLDRFFGKINKDALVRLRTTIKELS